MVDKKIGLCLGFLGLGFLLMGRRTAQAQDPFLECRIAQVTQEEIFTDCGASDGLGPGDFGTVIRGGIEINRVRVLSTSRRSSRVRLLRSDSARVPTVKDTIVFVVPPSQPEPEKKQDFVPLLAPEPKQAKAASSNIFHGRLRLRRLIRQSPRGDVEYNVSRLGSDGSVDRLFGSRWSLTWSGDASYKEGPAYTDDPEYKQAKVTLYSATLQGNFSNGSFVRAGRFLPNEIYTFGYLEGIQWHAPLSKHVQMGLTGGFKPDPLNLNSNTNQPNLTQYVSTEWGQRQWLHSSTLIGLHHAFFDHKLDRRAVVVDQKAGLGSRLSLQVLSEVDFDVQATTHSHPGALLTRLNVYTNANVFSFLSLRAGVERTQRPNNRAERDLLGPSVDETYFDQVYRRLWGGSTLQLPLSLSLDGDVSFYKETTSQNSPAHWRGMLTRRGLPFVKEGSISGSIYNLIENNIDYLGGLSTIYLPFANGRFNIFGSWGMREFATTSQAKDWKSTDYSIQADWRATKKIHVRGGLTHTFPIYVASDLIDVNMDYRW